MAVVDNEITGMPTKAQASRTAWRHIRRRVREKGRQSTMSDNKHVKGKHGTGLNTARKDVRIICDCMSEKRYGKMAHCGPPQS